MVTDKSTSKTPALPGVPPAPKTAARVKAAEVLKVAYTRPNDAVGITKLVIFGTDGDRSDFLRDHSDEWWRIADVAKGEVLEPHTGPKPKTNG